MVISSFAPDGVAPPTIQWLVDVGDGDQISCEVSTPPNWNGKKIIAMLHGLSGSHHSSYMIRMARKLYNKGFKVVRINLRNCGSGFGLSKKPAGAGNSKDVLKLLQALKEKHPHAEIDLVGFSLGGNTTLKLAGELGAEASKLVKTFFAVCPPLELEETARLIQLPGNEIYHHYYLSRMRTQSKNWIKEPIHSIKEYDEKVTAPIWGFKDAHEYYTKCSSMRFINQILTDTHIIFAEDDPFVSLEPLKTIELPECVHVWTTPHGSHLAFLGRAKWQWLDDLLLHWIDGDFETDALPQ